MSGACFIKVREKGRKAWAFLARGGTSRLRVHASRFETPEKAQALIDANAADNPEWEWKVVPA
jgi:hypothetical protein